MADVKDERTLPTGPSTCLSEYLSAKVSSGAARLTLRNVVSAVRGAEDPGLMPPTVLPIHWRLAKGGLSSGRQPYFSPPAPSFLAQAARTREQRIALGLGCINYVLWLRVSEAATIAPRDLQASGMASFTATKVGRSSEERRPLGRWVAGWAAYLLALVGESADPAQPFAERGAPGLEETIKDMLRNSRWSHLRWHAFRRGGCAACYHRGPHLGFLLWWGWWWRLQTALEYATRYADQEVVGPLLLPMADAGDFVGSWRFRSKTSGRRPCTPRKWSPSRIWSKGWAPNLPPMRGRQSKPEMVRATSPPVPTPQSLPQSCKVHPSSRPGLLPQARSAVLESPHWGPPRANVTEAPSSLEANPPQGAGRVAAGPSASGAQLVPRPPSQQAEIRALSRRQSGGGCLLWVVPYVSTALYQVARRWCWVVAQSGVVPPPGAVYVGVAPTGVRAPLVVPERCLGGGRGPKSLARWESR